MAKPVTLEGGTRVHFLTEPEDYLFCHLIDIVNPYVPPTDQKWARLKHYFFNEGKGVHDLGLITLNDNLKRKGHEPLILRPTHSDSHSLISGMPKAEIRAAILRQLQEMSPSDRQLVIDHKRKLVAEQTERDPVQDAVRAQRFEQGPTVLAEKLASVSLPILPAKGVRPAPIEISKPAAKPVELPAEAPVEAAEGQEARVPHGNTGTVGIHRDGQRTRVPKAEVEQRLAEGWKIGFKQPAPPPSDPTSPHLTETIWVRRGAVRQRISRNELEQRLCDGWVRGRGPNKSQEIQAPAPVEEPIEVATSDEEPDIWSLRREISALRGEVTWLADEVAQLRAPRARHSAVPPAQSVIGRRQWR